MLIEGEEPNISELYFGHSRAICRADIARYLVLKRYGGLYVDLDFECFKALDPLLVDTAFAIGAEPESHLAVDAIHTSGFKRVLCSALIASAPRHMFWDVVFTGLLEARRESDVLDATGPLLLTRCFDQVAQRGQADEIRVLPATSIYPVDKFDCWSGRLFDIARWEKLTRDAYALHHWDGSWFTPPAKRDIPRELSVTVSSPDHLAELIPSAGLPAVPLVSCLMVTRDRPAQALLAVNCFRAQTYPNRELVVVDDGVTKEIADAVAGDPRIRYIRPDDPAPNLGRARNRAVAEAHGTFICQWDDDDLYDPARIEVQMAALRLTDARACLLVRWMIWWPSSGRLAISPRRLWEGSLLCEKAVLGLYPEITRGEDTPVVEALIRSTRVANLDAPRLYLYVVHGQNTFEADHFEEHWRCAEERYSGDRYGAVLNALGKRLPCRDYPLFSKVQPAKDGQLEDAIERAFNTAVADAQRLLAAGYFDQAAHAFEEVRRSRPERPEGLDGLARAQCRAGRWAEGADLWSELTVLFPGRIVGHLCLGQSLTLLGRFEEADEAFARAEALQPDLIEARIARAEVAAASSDWPLARKRWHGLNQAWPAHPRPVIGLVQAHLALGAAVEAERCLIAAAAVLPEEQMLLARATILHWMRRDDELYELLKQHASIVKGNPKFSGILGIVAQFRRSRGVVRAPEQSSETATDLLATAVEADGPNAMAVAASSLVTLWRQYGLQGLDPGAFTLTIRALEEVDGQRSAAALLDAVEALPSTDARAIRLKMHAAFERLRVSGGETSASLRALAGQRNPRAPFGFWSEAVLEAADLYDRAESFFSYHSLDSGHSAAAARRVLDRILHAVRARRPLSLIRLGDGEGCFLNYPAGHDELALSDRETTQRIWWGEPRLVGSKAELFRHQFLGAVRRADIVGVPDPWWFCSELPLPCPRDLFAANGMRPLVSIYGHLRRAMADEDSSPLFRMEQLLTSAHIHADLSAFGLYDELFAQVRTVSVVTCHHELAGRLRELFGLAVARTYFVPHEHRYGTVFGYAEGEHHFPDAFERLRNSLHANAGDVFLVAAGFLGKIYCDLIRERGGIALDVGSAADYWCGYNTRMMVYRQRFARLPEAADTRSTASTSSRYNAKRSLNIAKVFVRSDSLPRATGDKARLPRIDLYGDLSGATGLAKGARGFVQSLEAASLEHNAIDIAAPPDETPRARPGISIVSSNPWVMNDPRYWPPRGGLRPEMLSAGLNVGVWVWETPTARPSNWQQALGGFHEIWTPSRFSAHCLESTLAVKAHVIPHVVTVGTPAPARGSLGLSEDDFLFCLVFDGQSNPHRKNAIGAIRAFHLAFPRGGARFLLKARTLAQADFRELQAAIGSRNDIDLRIGEATDNDTLALIASCNAYVSLHRAEGFGLTIAEAMALGKPVIATAYSGNTEFMSEATAFPVSFRLETTDRRHDDYLAGTVWAEPDVEHAAALMRTVYDQPNMARARGVAAARYIAEHHSPETIGALIRSRVEALLSISPNEPIGTLRRPQVRAAERPRVLVLTPVRNAEAYLPAYREALLGLEYPKHLLSIAFLEGDSRDGSRDFLECWLPELRSLYERAELMHYSAHFHYHGPRWATQLQRQRRSTLARLRNRLLQAALRNEDWVLWIDADVIGYRPDTLEQLLGAGGRIITPNCVKRPGGPSFDLNAYQSTVGSPHAEHQFLHDGIVQPPKGVGRLYLDSFRGEQIVRLDGVGGTMLLVEADLHREGLVFPAYSHGGYIETEGLAKMALDLGVKCWGMPGVEVIHADA